jgi:hypothetical protein
LSEILTKKNQIGNDVLMTSHDDTRFKDKDDDTTKAASPTEDTKIDGIESEKIQSAGLKTQGEEADAIQVGQPFLLYLYDHALRPLDVTSHLCVRLTLISPRVEHACTILRGEQRAG